MSDQNANPPAQTQEGRIHVPPENVHLMVAGRDLRFATITELFNEIERRSVGCLLIAYNIQGLEGSYTSKVRGDVVCVRSLSILLASEIEMSIRPSPDGKK